MFKRIIFLTLLTSTTAMANVIDYVKVSTKLQAPSTTTVSDTQEGVDYIYSRSGVTDDDIVYGGGNTLAVANAPTGTMHNFASASVNDLGHQLDGPNATTSSSSYSEIFSTFVLADVNPLAYDGQISVTTVVDGRLNGFFAEGSKIQFTQRIGICKENWNGDQNCYEQAASFRYTFNEGVWTDTFYDFDELNASPDKDPGTFQAVYGSIESTPFPEGIPIEDVEFAITTLINEDDCYWTNSFLGTCQDIDFSDYTTGYINTQMSLIVYSSDWAVLNFENTSATTPSFTNVTASRPAGSNDNYVIGTAPLGYIPQERSLTVPEPSAIALMGLGLLGFVAARRRKSQA